MHRSVVAAALCCVAALSAQQPAPTPEQNPVFTVSSTLVQVDAEVTDSKHHHITDLQASDFEVLLDGKVQPITNFTYVHLDDPSPNGLPPGAKPSANIQPEYVRRSIVMVVDDLGLSFPSMYYVRRALHAFVDKSMQPGDLVAIWQTGRSNSVFQQLTSDKHLLSAAIDSLLWNPQGRGLLDALRDEENPFESALAAGAMPRNDTRLTAGEQDEKEYLTAGLAGAALNTLSELSNELLTVGGRKAVVLFSDGFPVGPYGEFATVNQRTGGSPAEETFRKSMRDLIDRANRSGTVFYTIDARGLEYLEPDGAMGHMASQRPLVALADQTGGFALINNNGLADALGRIRDDQQGYYLIGFKAPAKISAKPGDQSINFHSLHVHLKTKGLQIRSRAGFWGQTDAAARPDYKGPEAQMRLAAFSLFNRSDIHVRLTALYTRSADSRPAVRNLLYIDPHDLSFKTNAAGLHTTHLDILAMASGSGIDGFASVNRSVDVSANDDNLAKLKRDGILLAINVPLKGTGPYQVRASVRDANSSLIGSAGQFLEIPDLKKVHLALTTPMVSDLSAHNSRTDPSMVLREFHAGSNLSFVSMVETDRDETKKPAASAFQAALQLYSDGKPILDTPLPVKDVMGRNVHALQAEIRLNESLPAGHYYLRATATDNGGKTPHSASTWVDFQIVP